MRRLHTTPGSPRGRGARSGVTLVEVVIAIFVLTVGVLSIISLFPSGYNLSQGAVNRSVAALAARDAMARILAESKRDSFTFPKEPTLTNTTDEPLYRYYYAPTPLTTLGVRESNRVGIIASVASASSLTCTILGNETPSTTSSSVTYWPNLVNYYFVITSGAAAGAVFKISSSTGGTVTFDSAKVKFRTGTDTSGLPVRAGDAFAIIGNKSGTQPPCYPANFLDGGTDRTIPIATQGDPALPYAYSYGCIISASALDKRHIFRVDVFVFRNIQSSGSIEEQDRAVGHFVTYLHNLESYDRVFESN